MTATRHAYLLQQLNCRLLSASRSGGGGILVGGKAEATPPPRSGTISRWVRNTMDALAVQRNHQASAPDGALQPLWSENL
ncbi:hypothetical protein MMC07_003897 [Pseudocyphellaria aurata]|nr:hypothetical protein [Pseudocyphellaria aurata]